MPNMNTTKMKMPAQASPEGPEPIIATFLPLEAGF